MPTKAIPFEFILEALDGLNVRTKPMFGCTAVYVDEKIIFILREKSKPTADDGIWFATSAEHHASLRIQFPSLRSISVLGNGPTNWQVLPSNDDDFEAKALLACELVQRADPRIGRVPKPRSLRKKSAPQRKPK